MNKVGFKLGYFKTCPFFLLLRETRIYAQKLRLAEIKLPILDVLFPK